MNILFVSYHYWPPHFGGELKIGIERFKTLVERGHSVTVLTAGVVDMPQQEIIDGILVKRSPILFDSRIGRGFRRLIFPIWSIFQMQKFEFDVLHHGGTGGINAFCNFLGMAIVNWSAHLKGAKTFIVHSLADTEKEMFSNHGIGKQLRNLNLKNIDSIVSVSPALHLGVKSFFPDSAKLIIPGVHDGVFLPLPKSEKDQFRFENQVSNNEIVFSFLGSVSKRKGFDLLLTSFLEMIDQFPNLRLWFIGPKGKMDNQNLVEEEINELIEPLENHQELVHFWGRIDDQKTLANIIGSSDIFVFPSRKEGFGIAPLEAMATGIPVIISRIPGVTDIANIEGQTGLYVEVNNLEELKTAMRRLAIDRQLREKMGKNAHQRIKENFGWQRHIDEWEKLYCRN